MTLRNPRQRRSRADDSRSNGRLGLRSALIAVVVVGSLIGLFVGIVAAGTVVIGFEQFVEGTELTTQYQADGVVFPAQGDASAGAIVKTCDAEDADCVEAWEEDNVIVTPIGVEQRRHPLVAQFEDPQQAVSLYVRQARGIDGAQTAELIARDGSGENVARSSVDFDAGNEWHPIAVTTESARIVEIRLTLAFAEDPQTPHNRFVADELTYYVNDRPEAAFHSSSDNPTVDESVTFDASASIDFDGEIATYAWDFDGDGRPDRNTTSPLTSYTFQEGGSHTIRLTVVDDNGAIGRTERSLQVNERPVASIDPANADPTIDEPVTFDATGSFDPDGEIVTYMWDFDGDRQTDQTTSTPTASHVYREADTYTVTLRVIDDNGATADTQFTIQIPEPPADGGPWTDVIVGGIGGLVGVLILHGGVARFRNRHGSDENRPPIANIDWAPREPTPRRPVLFDGSRSIDPDPDDRIDSYRWTIEDHELTSPRVVHVFLTPDEYVVELQVSNLQGEIGTHAETIQVEAREGDLVLERPHPDAPGDDHEHLIQEYLVFRNAGDDVLDLGDWTVHDAAEEEDQVTAGEHAFEFPDGLVLEPDRTVTIHTGSAPKSESAEEQQGNERHLYWGKSRAVWNNDRDTIVVEDDESNPVMAVRYERTDEGEYTIEHLDEEPLADWFSDVVMDGHEPAPLAGITPDDIREAMSSVARIGAGAAVLRGPREFLRSWAVITVFFFLGTFTWDVSASIGVITRSINPRVPLLLMVLAISMLMLGGMWLIVAGAIAALRE